MFSRLRARTPWAIPAATLGVLLFLPGLSPAAEPFTFKTGDRVLLSGDTFFEREVNYGTIEAHLTAALPATPVTFRNLSWAADTPLGKSRASFDWNKSPNDWLKRVREQVALVKPTVAILNYGMTAALDEQAEGPASFRRDLGMLLDAVQEASGQPVRFILCTPLQPNFRAFPAESSKSSERLSRDAETSLRQRVLAIRETLEQLARERAATVLDLHALSARAASDPANYDSPILLSESGHRAVAALIPGALGLAPHKHPPKAALETLTHAIQLKNEQFFHRWRPANWTYLFGFRKHEQGRNSVEIPRFDPLVEAWDARIAKLRPLQSQDPAAVAEVRNALQPTDHHDPNFRPQPLPTFTVADGFEVSLWAENPMLYKPIQMNWDAQGRLWVASSRVYPQIQPGQHAEDAILVIEDTNADGKADRSTVFADRILIPTGVVPDNQGGCYAACSHELYRFKDSNGDGKADIREIALTSFGTEDTHHNLHTLRWGYDGHLYMNQSIYTHSHVETPHGVVRLNSGGIWRFDPMTWKLEVFTRGGCNPWGHHWDQWGNHFFTDGAGFKGVYHAMRGATYFTYSDMRREAESISPGNYPKFASIELIHSPAFPADWQDHVVTCDFRAHRVVRFALEDSGSTFQTREKPDLLRSTNVTFRPIDVRFGPDGALYIADWSNPIIQHGEVDFRDPRRDHEHGRIWRVARTGTPAGRPENLTRLANRDLLDRTLSPNGWTQEQSRRVLVTRGPGVLKDARTWLAAQSSPRATLEVVWLHEAFGRPVEDLLPRLATSTDPRLRTAAARQLNF